MPADSKVSEIKVPTGKEDSKIGDQKGATGVPLSSGESGDSPTKAAAGAPEKAPVLDLGGILSKKELPEGTKATSTEGTKKEAGPGNQLPASTSNQAGGTQQGQQESGAGGAEEKKKEEFLTTEWWVSDDSLFTFLNSKKEGGEGTAILFEKREFMCKIRIGKRKNLLFLNEKNADGKKTLIPGLENIQEPRYIMFKVRRYLNYNEYMRHKDSKSFSTNMSYMHLQCRFIDSTYYLCCNEKLGYFLINENEIDEGFFESSVFQFGDPEIIGQNTGSIPNGRRIDVIKMKPNPSETLLKSNPFTLANCEKSILLGFEENEIRKEKQIEIRKEKRKVVSVVLIEKDPLIENEYQLDKLTENSRFHICFTNTNDPNQLHTIGWSELSADEKVANNNKAKDVYKLEKKDLCYIEAHRKKVINYFDQKKQKEEQRRNQNQRRLELKNQREQKKEQELKAIEEETKKIAEREKKINERDE